MKNRSSFYLSVAVVAILAGGLVSCEENEDKGKGVKVTEVRLNRDTLTLKVNESTALVAMVFPDNATDKTVSWSSSNKDVATVMPNGLVTAISEGATTVVVSTQDGNKTASCVVIVNNSAGTEKVSGVQLNKTTLTLEMGEREMLIATVLPNNAADKSVTWETSDDGIVATVDNNGNVTAVSVGKATITVKTKDGNFTDVCVVTVISKIEDNFEIQAIARLQNGESVFSNTILVKDFANISTFTSTVIASTPVSLHLYVKNTSGKVIPAGTPYEFRFKRNGKEVDANIYTSKKITTTGVLSKDLEINGTYQLYTEEPFYVNSQTEIIGSNNFSVEVLQLGKKPYASPKTGTCNYQIQEIPD